MRFLLVLVFVFVAFASSNLPDQSEVGSSLADRTNTRIYDVLDLLDDYNANKDDLELDVSQEDDIMQRGRITSWKLRRLVYKIQKQMPCGWPNYGIPPLAPFKYNEAEVSLQRGFIDTSDKIFHFRIDGLDDFRIKKFKTNIFAKKIQFDFLFHNIIVSADKLESNTIFDAMQDLGIFVQYKGDGSGEFSLHHLRVFGVLKYKLPVLVGSAKITSLKIGITLEKCNSNVSGFVGGDSFDSFINRQIEKFVEKGIVKYNAEISDLIEAKLVPIVNRQLKGKDFWTIIDKIFSNNAIENEDEDDPIFTNCVPSADTWD